MGSLVRYTVCDEKGEEGGGRGVGRGARYRETRCDSYRKRCGCEAVSCGVTAMASEGALLLVLQLVDPLVLLGRGVALLAAGIFESGCVQLIETSSGTDVRLTDGADEGIDRGRVVKKDGNFAER